MGYGSIGDPTTRLITYQAASSVGPPFVAFAHHFDFGVGWTGAVIQPEVHDLSDVVL